MRAFDFQDLSLLWALAPLVLVWIAARLLLALWRRRRGVGEGVRFSTLRHLGQLRKSPRLLLRRAVQGLRLVTLVLLLVAMTRPQTGRKLTEVRTEGIDIALVLDTSGSMRALDLDADHPIQQRRNRLEVAKSVIESFVDKRENDQIGLVVFGQEAFTQCPMTLDHGVLLSFLENIDIGIAGDATAIGSAIGTAAKRLEDSEAKSRIIIVLTDGINNAGALNPVQAARAAAALGIKVYTIGAATRGAAPFLVDTVFGQRVVHQDVELDEDTLREVAEVSGGAYFRAEDSEALERIYDEIDELETTEITTTSYMEYNEEFHWFVLPAIGLLLLEVGLLGTRLVKLP